MWVASRWGCLVAVLALSACSAGRKSQWEAPPQSRSASVDADALVAEGDAAWAQRVDVAQLHKAIERWEAASTARPQDAALWAKLSRAYYLLADAHLRKQGEKSAPYLETFEKGTAAGERALAASNADFKKAVTQGESVEKAIPHVGKESLDGMYWFAVNLSKWAKAKGLAARLANKDRVKAVMNRALALDPDFFHAAPHRFFGAYHVVAPDGTLEKSKEHFEESLRRAPAYAGTRVLMAELYATKKDDRALFEKLLKEVLAMPDDAIPGLEAETRSEKEKAQELLSKVDALF
jgi:hypothetical protein